MRPVRWHGAGWALAGILALAACSGEEGAGGEVPSVFSDGADQVMLGVEHYMTHSGVRRGELEADTAYTYEDASRVELGNLRIQFFDPAGGDRGVLTARDGVYALESGDMTVHGNVVLDGSLLGGGRARLETDSLAYVASDDRLTTDAPWTLTHDDGSIERGVGLVTDPSLSSIRARDWRLSAPDVEVPR